MQISQVQKIANTKRSKNFQIFNNEEIKHFLRLNDDQDIPVVSDIIQGVIEELERKTSITLAEAQWCVKVMNFSGNYFNSPKSKIQRIENITYKLGSNTYTLDRSEFSTSNGVIYFRCALCTPLLTINFIAGCSNSNEINPEIKLMIKQRVISIYENQNLQHDWFAPFKRYRL